MKVLAVPIDEQVFYFPDIQVVLLVKVVVILFPYRLLKGICRITNHLRNMSYYTWNFDSYRKFVAVVAKARSFGIERYDFS